MSTMRRPRDDDELDDIVGEDSDRNGKSKQIKRRSDSEGNRHISGPKGIVRVSRFPSLKTVYMQSRKSLNPVWLWGQGIRTLMLHRSTWLTGLPFLIVGLILAFIGEVMRGPQYNVIVLVVLMGAFAFPKFPDNTMRPQLVIVLITCVSLLLDVSVFSSPTIGVAPKAVTAMVLLAKGLALYQFLWYTKNATKARKYFIRRVRVFLVPWARPKNILRELRSRILAIELLQFAAIIAYMTLFFIAVVHFGYLDLVTGPRRGVALAAFLPLKTVSSGLVFYGLFTDTDPVLCLAHFGILGGCMKSVKAYVRKKFEEYDGWPLAYGLNKYRFYVIIFVKFVDWCWGLAGWAALGTYLGQRYYILGGNVKAFVASCVFILCLTDIYIPILFGVVYWLIGENKHRLEVIVREHKESGQMTAEFDDGDRASDDSELDDFGFRAVVESRDQDVEHSMQLGQARGMLSPDRFAKASRVDFSKSIRWDGEEEGEGKGHKKHTKKKKKKTKKTKKHRHVESGSHSDEDYVEEKEFDDKFVSNRTISNVVGESRLQSLVDDDSAPQYMRGLSKNDQHIYHINEDNMDESEGAETTIEFAKAMVAAPPARGGAFVSPRAPPPAPVPDIQNMEPHFPPPGTRGVIKVPPLQLRRSASTNDSDVKFSRPLLGSQNSLNIGTGDDNSMKTNKPVSISVGKGDAVLDWRAGDSSHETKDPPIRRAAGGVERHIENTSYIDGTAPAARAGVSSGDDDVSLCLQDISAEDYSALWESLETALSSEYELTAASALSQDDMLIVIIDHLTSNGFGIAASGIVDNTLTVFSYSSSDTRRFGYIQCLVELKLVQLGEAVNESNKLSWQLEFICKCSETRMAKLFLRRMKLHFLLGTDELLFEDA